ncbi:TPA: hypothetical protein EYP66_25100 [Candidatus Poribacteria bacterium]|nr:hypothetical protein [Candidatus Poribacteria bacterium]
MLKSSFKILAPFALVLGLEKEAVAQTSPPNPDNFWQATDEYISNKIETKIRQGLTDRLIEAIGSQTLEILAKQIPGVLARTPNQLTIIREALLLSFSSSPLNQGEEEWLRDQDRQLEPLPPREDDFPDVIRWVFEVNQCVATEDQLADAISSRSDARTANIVIVNWGKTPIFLQNYQVISRDPYTYRFIGSEICGASGSESTLTIQLSKAARWLVDQAINEGCDGRGGQMSPDGIFVRDLDGDGQDDLVLMHDGIRCEGTPEISNLCGAKVCEGVVFLRRGGLLDRANSFMGTGLKIGSGRNPTISFLQHDLSEFSFGWDGQNFAKH